jgi:hypothetical protein
VHTTEIVSVVVFMLLQQLDARQSAHMASLMWSIWKHKNLKLWQNVSTTSTQVVDHVTQLIEDWEHANLVRQRQQSRDSPSGNNNVSYSKNDGSGSRNNDQGSNTIVAPASRSNQAHPTWVKLTTERYNGNIDASFSSQRNRVGIRMCIRDDEGRFVLAKTMWMSPICNNWRSVGTFSCSQLGAQVTTWKWTLLSTRKRWLITFIEGGMMSPSLGMCCLNLSKFSLYILKTLVSSLIGDKQMR